MTHSWKCPLKRSYCKEHCGEEGKDCMYNKDWYSPDVKAWAETEDNYIKQDDIISELERENQMMRARNERLEKEIKWLETMVNNLQIELTNSRSAPAAKPADSTTT